jgi:hypothetical protein
MDLTSVAGWCLGIGFVFVGVSLALALSRPRAALSRESAPATGVVIAGWAANAGYDLVSVSDQAPADDRVAAAFGYTRWDRPSQVCRVKLKDNRDKVHDAWVLMAGHEEEDGFTPDFIEVAWDDRSAEHGVLARN